MLAATLVLLIAKLATIAVPFTYKWAVDGLTGQSTGPVETEWWVWLIASPLIMTIAYGGMRIVMAVLTQFRDGIFASVAMHAVRRLAYLTFVHMHELSLRFHLERKTGGLTRILERGRTGIEVMVRMVILQLMPTLVEVALVAGVLFYQFDWRYVLVILVTVAIYMYFTYLATEWRIEIRRRMNESDTEANTKAIDSLLNYETVKYFGAEAREATRYDRSMERYERASVRTYTSLAVLNAGQAVIFTIGLGVVMVMCAIGVRNGTHTVGDFVMINAMMIQLYQPLNFMGMVYREIKQAIIDIEKMFGVLAREAEVKDVPGREAAAGHKRRDPLREREVRLRAGPADPAGIELRGARRQDGRRRRPVGRGQVHALAPDLSPLRRRRRAHHHRRPEHRRASPSIRCVRRSAWCRRTRCCSTTPSATTSATAAGRRATPRSRRRRGWRRSTASSACRRRATKPKSASAG